MEAKICTAVVTYNRLDLLKGAIESLKRQTMETDLLIVNNGSTDGTKEYLEQQKGLIIINQENVGGAGGFYAALKYIAENGYDFAWVMDDDIIASEDTLANLYNAYVYLKNESVGFLCSSVFSPAGFPVNVPEVDMRPNQTGYPDWDRYLDKSYVKVRCATFVSVFIPVSIIKEVGLPLKEFFIWGDDTEYTKRISSKYNCYLVGNSFIQHLRNGGELNLRNIDDPRRIQMFRYFIRNNYYNTKKFLNWKDSIKYFFYYLREALYFAIKGNLKKSIMIIKGLFQGYSFKPTINYPK